MSQPNPAVTVNDFKSYFDRDFPYGDGFDTIRDNDIVRALSDAAPVFNPDLWDGSEVKTAYLYASAHFLALNLQAAGGLKAVGGGRGIESRGDGIIQSKGVGSVNVAYAIPESIKEDRLLNGFMQTHYGKIYLQMMAPRLVGFGVTVSGFDDVTQGVGVGI